MIYATLTGYKVKPLHQYNAACIANVCVMADWVVKYIIQLLASLKFPIRTLADTYALFFFSASLQLAYPIAVSEGNTVIYSLLYSLQSCTATLDFIRKALQFSVHRTQ